MEFVCSACDYVTCNMTNIKRHVRLHTGERPFKCPVCNKDFNEKGNLKKHFVVHKNVLFI